MDDVVREDMGEKLVEGGYDPGLRTLFLLSGVAAYLDESAVQGLELERDLKPDDAEQYLTRADGSVLGRSYGFGGVALVRVPVRP